MLSSAPQFQTVRREKLGQQISRQLLAAIASGVYRPGDLLPSERELTTMFGASRVAVREALSDLAAKGVANVTHGRGTSVNPVEQWNALDPTVLMLMNGEQAFDQLDEVRRIVEPELAALAAERITDAELETLRAISDLPEDDTMEQHVERDMNFHLAIARATRNPVLLVVLSSLDDLLRESRRRAFAVPGALAKARASHLAVFEAISRRDPVSARRAMVSHMEQVADAIARHKAQAD
jgi:GntR family transcriptional regulator, transcriptional repressor for pyruvate dehydrogenase complex